MVWNGRHRGVIYSVMIAVIGELFSLPGFKDDLERFSKPFLAFSVRDTEHIIGTSEPATSDTELESPFADMIDSGYFFCDA